MIKNKERDDGVNFIMNKAKMIDKSLAEYAYDIIPSWRDIGSHKCYIFALVEDEFDTYWIVYDVEDARMKYINTYNDIGDPIIEYSLQDVSDKMYALLIKDNKDIDFGSMLADISKYDTMILYIKLTK